MFVVGGVGEGSVGELDGGGLVEGESWVGSGGWEGVVELEGQVGPVGGFEMQECDIFRLLFILMQGTVLLAFLPLPLLPLAIAALLHPHLDYQVGPFFCHPLQPLLQRSALPLQPLHLHFRHAYLPVQPLLTARQLLRPKIDLTASL